MSASKLNVKTSLVLAFAFVLSACDLPAPKERDGAEGGANFNVASVEGSWGETETHQKFSIPRSRLLNLKACLKDLARSRPLSGQDFEIQEVALTRTADAQGCVTWSEKLEFNYFSESKYLRLERRIVAKGLARGGVTVALGVNPWSHGESTQQVVDLDKSRVDGLVSAPAEVRAHLLGEAAGARAERRLWLEDARLVVTDDRLTAGGLRLTHQLVGTPKLVLSKMNGERALEPLSRGTFDVDVHLVHQDVAQGQEIRRVFAAQKLTGVEMSNESLALRAPFLLPEVPKSGQLFIALRLQPVDAPAGLLPFVGLYPLGDYRSIKTGGFLKLSALVIQNPAFRLEDFLTEKDSLTHTRPLVSPTGEVLAAPTPASPPREAGDVTGDRAHFQRASVEVDHLHFVGLQRGKETSQRKEIRYRVRACLRSGVDQDALTSRPFVVTPFRTSADAKVEPLKVTTDNTSCLYWDEAFEFEVYQCQRYLKGFVEIRNDDLGFNQRIEYFLNPWEFEGLLAIDSRDVARAKNLTTACDPARKLSARLQLDSATFSTLSYDYDIDAGLNMAMRKKVLFRLEPQVLLSSSLSAGIEERRPLRDGVYLLRTLVLRNKDYDSSNTYVTHAQKLTNVIGGKISAELEFVSHDLKSLGNRNTLIVELHAADPARVSLDPEGRPVLKDPSSKLEDTVHAGTELVSGSFRGAIILNQDSQSTPLELIDQAAQARYLLGADAREGTTPRWMDAVIAKGLEKRREQLKDLSRLESAEDFARRTKIPLMSPATLKTPSELAKGLGVKPADYRAIAPIRRYRTDFWPGLKARSAPLGVLGAAKIARGEIDADAAFSLCVAFGYELLKDRLGRGQTERFIAACTRVIRESPQAAFVVAKRELIHRLERAEFVGGTPKSLSVTAAFSLSKSLSQSYTESKNISLNGGLGVEPFGFLSLGISGGMVFDWSTSEADTAANAVSVSENTNLSVRESRFKLKVSGVERCSVVRLRPALFAEKSFWSFTSEPSFLNYLDSKLKPHEVAETARRGILFCTGEVERTAQERQESYFLIYQDVSGGDVQDSADPRNRPFFIALRGRADYARFVNVIKGAAQMPASAESEGLDDEQLVKFLEAHFLTAPVSPGHLQHDAM